MAAVQAKDFYSAGTTFTALGCAAAVSIGWQGLERIWHIFEPEWVPFGLSFLIVYAYAYVLPEPEDYDDAGERKLTGPELIFGFFNALIVFVTVVGMRDGFHLF
jgi:hypothetical protein